MNLPFKFAYKNKYHIYIYKDITLNNKNKQN